MPEKYCRRSKTIFKIFLTFQNEQQIPDKLYIYITSSEVPSRIFNSAVITLEMIVLYRGDYRLH